MKVDALVSARYILTVDEAGTVLEDHTVVIKDKKIVDIVPTTSVNEQYSCDNHTKLETHALIPGLINAHTHMAMNNMRGSGEDMCLSDWLIKKIWPTEAKFVSHEFVYDGTKLAMAELLLSGTTCAGDMYFYPEAIVEAGVESGMRVVVGSPLLDFPTNYASNFDEYLEKSVACIKKNKHHPTIHFAIAPHAPYTVSDDHLIRAWEVAEKYKLPYHVHLHETKDEVDDSVTLKRDSMSCHRSDHKLHPIANFSRLGLIGPRLHAVHMTQLTDDEIQLLASKKANVVHCPTSNMKLVSGFCPVVKLNKAGVNVALGTDGAASNNCLSMLAEIKTTVLLGKVLSKDATALGGQTVLRMATINGARSLGISHLVGSLEKGKYADMTAINMDTLSCIPVFDPVGALVYSTDSSQVSDVWVAGRHLLKSRKLQTLDEGEIRKKTAVWRDKIKAELDANK
eukprot:NODE_350_length_1605_cov_90.217185_g318_i0.p1 GENE.NODE_350_length_1605_cov_90.217185_g318_i0~~NODE_350_length_1605_cov_90.217185_g318_i0.p1  ORF type:complete len:454 (+),score=85.72 NODE_350_length_1605_cov_90.217185_g318_i0:57-1418(+)